MSEDVSLDVIFGIYELFRNAYSFKWFMEKDVALIPLDTTAEALAVQVEALRKMDISKRAQMTFELSDNLRSIVESGIRQRHPDYSPEEIQRAALGLTIDRALFKEAFGGREVPA